MALIHVAYYGWKNLWFQRSYIHEDLVMETKGIIKTGTITEFNREPNYAQKSSLPTGSTHHLVASADHAYSPAPTSLSVWSHDLEPKDLSLCTALPYHQFLLKRQEKETLKKASKIKIKSLQILFWSFCLLSHSALLVWG